MDRPITYGEAIREAIGQEMSRDAGVILFGLGVTDPKGILGTTKGLEKKYGADRVFDTPLSEDAMTGVAIGAALAGLRPVHVHIRMDFLLLAMNQLVNMAAKIRYMFGGQISAPMVVRAMIGKSWGQGPQHSQALYSFFMHVPGIKVVAPSTPHDAKGCLVAAIRDNNPVLFVEHRLLYYQTGHVPAGLYEVMPGKSRITGAGKDITIVGISYMQLECLRARFELEAVGISAEVIDPVWLSPLDVDTITESVRRTGRLLVVDNAWIPCGAGPTIVASVMEKVDRPVRVRQMGFQPATCPTSPSLEYEFYPNARSIASTAFRMVRGEEETWMPGRKEYPETIAFKGPF